MAKSPNVQEVRVEAMVASRSLEPAVMLRIGEMFTTMTVDKAREIAAFLIESAESAEQDAFMIEFVMKNLGLEREEAGRLLVAFRDYREERRRC